MPVTSAYSKLADAARQFAGHAAHAPGGSLDRKAALCCAVALAESSSVAAARKVLAGVERDDIRRRAEQILGELADQAHS
jgi:hypothetical protein